MPVLPVLPALIIAAIATAMPAALPVETLNGTSLSVPRDVRGGTAILVVTFDRGASSQAKEWTNELRNTFAVPSIPVYQVAVLDEVPSFARSVVVSQIRRSVPESLRDDFVIASKNGAEWRQAAGFSAPNEAYVLMTTRKGLILWRAHGKFARPGLAEAAAASARAR